MRAPEESRPQELQPAGQCHSTLSDTDLLQTTNPKLKAEVALAELLAQLMLARQADSSNAAVLTLLPNAILSAFRPRRVEAASMTSSCSKLATCMSSAICITTAYHMEESAKAQMYMSATEQSVRQVHCVLLVSCIVIKYLCNALLTAPVVGDVRRWGPQVHLQSSGRRHCR